MTIRIEDVRYHPASEVAEELGVTRQTLWRWRSAGKIPPGRRFRNRQVLFTDEELAEIREFAFRLEPIEGYDPRQLGLFSPRRSDRT